MSLARAFLAGERQRRVETHQSQLLVFITIVLVAGSHQKSPEENSSIPKHPVGHGDDILWHQGTLLTGPNPPLPPRR